MAANAAAGEGRSRLGKEEAKVVFASSLGTVFEWYDFYLYATLAPFFAALFFPKGNDTAALLSAFATYAAGFLVRPFGALFFGRLGDLIGRKYTFLVTISLMGGAPAAIGLLPTFASVGIWAPALLLTLRTLQGMALGGEYGGAAIYVAEHAPHGRRGFYTSFIQVAASVGFLLCLVIVLTTRHAMSAEAFEAWGWRVPFLFSLLLLALSLYIRMKLAESPVFQAMKSAGTTSKNPIIESLSDRANLGKVMVAMIGVTAGMTVIFYTSQFATLYFLQGTTRIPEEQALLYMAVGAFFAAPAFVTAGWLSDKVGRKQVLLVGYALALLLVFPIFHLIADGANPALAEATRASPVTIELPACDYSVFVKPESDCGKALDFISKRGIDHGKRPADTLALVVGGARVEGFDKTAYTAALVAAGYPDVADPARIVHWKIILGVVLIVMLSGLTYGPLAAILVEMFPAKIRYTSLSIPYHIGSGYFGGFLPLISQYIVVRTGDAYAGLWYTIAVVAVAFVVSSIWLRDTRHVDIHL
jgi:MFS family permease